MKFPEWIEKEAERRNAYKSHLIAEIAEKCGVSKLTVENASRGLKLSRYNIAKAVSDGTDGKVTVKELCE